MTNEQIILSNRFQLMEDGIIGTTGRMIVVENENGEKCMVSEPEEIHTFSEWKRRGYSVKKGENAIAKFVIWKHTEYQKKDDTEDGKTEKMFMKQAAFFKSSQVLETKK